MRSRPALRRPQPEPFMTHMPLPRVFARATTLLLAGLGLCATALAQAAPPACPYSPEQLKQVFGIGFTPGKPEPGMGTGCRYDTVGGSNKNDTDFALGLYIEPLMGSAESHRKMVMGPMHQYTPVSGDPDKAVTVKHGGSVSPFPQVAYERGGRMVRLQISGITFVPDEKSRSAKIDQFNQRLLKLPRLP